jgi:hypothetical protein
VQLICDGRLKVAPVASINVANGAGLSAGAASIAFSPSLFRNCRIEGVHNASDIAP